MSALSALNNPQYQSGVFVCVSVISGCMRIIAWKRSVSFYFFHMILIKVATKARLRVQIFLKLCLFGVLANDNMVNFVDCVNQEWLVKFFLVRKFFFLPTDPEKSWKVTGNDNIMLSRLIKYMNPGFLWIQGLDDLCVIIKDFQRTAENSRIMYGEYFDITHGTFSSTLCWTDITMTIHAVCERTKPPWECLWEGVAYRITNISEIMYRQISDTVFSQKDVPTFRFYYKDIQTSLEITGIVAVFTPSNRECKGYLRNIEYQLDVTDMPSLLVRYSNVGSTHKVQQIHSWGQKAFYAVDSVWAFLLILLEYHEIHSDN